MVLNLLILLNLCSLVGIAMVVPLQLALPGCDEKCGNVTIPYPFGFKDECSRDLDYSITCDQAWNGGTPTIYGIEVLEISLLDAQVIVKNEYPSSQCFNATGGRNSSYIGYSLLNSPFTFSSKRNKLIAIGCDTVAYFDSDFSGSNFTSGCISLCESMDSVTNGSCSGIGCCQTSIPLGIKKFYVRFDSYYDHVKNLESNPCNFGFLGDPNYFTFNSSDLSVNSFNRSKTPIVLDWAIGNQTCEEALHNESNACGPNSNCSNSINGPGYGYRCNCRDGFEGNPYLLQLGCQDINECENGYNNLCVKSGKCNNTIGSYGCYCPQGYHGDGWLNGTGCIQEPLKRNLVIQIIAATSGGFIILSIFIWFLYWAIQRKRKIRERFFQQNGGLLLQQQMDKHKGVKEIAKIFTTKELNKATNNFHESQILGQGGFGTVYKGILSGGIVVAIKKSKIMDKGQIIQFINEVSILSQINHRHVVKLLGCCLETEVPLLVYEFVSNGTLFQHIHIDNQTASFSWENRLRIATETADALAYLHSSHSVPILHRDVKSSNILLDDKYKAKVSDFGASRLVLQDQTLNTTIIQGTHGYLDPECLPTGQLTDKSDVYSFGVVLVELLTGKMPLLMKDSGERIALATYFVSSMKDENLFHILDDQIVTEGKREQLLVVAELARNCLKNKREDRPTMKEVAKELDSLKMLYEQPSLQQNQEETEPFLGKPWTNSTDATFEIEIGDGFTHDGLRTDDKVRGKTF